HVRLPLQFQNRRPQSPFIESTGASGGERIVIASPTTNGFAVVVVCPSQTQSAALPAKRVRGCKQMGFAPALRASDAIMTRLNTSSADLAKLRINYGQGRVIDAT